MYYISIEILTYIFLLDIEGGKLIKLKNIDINTLERIGSGTFGVVYKKDDKTAYKIYKKEITDFEWIKKTNPSLYLSKKRFNFLISKTKNIENVNPIEDTIYIENKLAGVKIPFCNGMILEEVLDRPLYLRIKIAKEIVKGYKELNNRYIYPTDCKLNNIIYCDDTSIKIIDLDDIRTHISYIPNILFNTLSIKSLSNTINILLNYKNKIYYSRKINKKLECQKQLNSISYGKIDRYIIEKEKSKNFIFVDNDSNISILKDFRNNNDYKIVYLINNDTNNASLNKIINYYEQNDLQLFNFLKSENINSYNKRESINKCLRLKKSDIIDIKY